MWETRKEKEERQLKEGIEAGVGFYKDIGTSTFGAAEDFNELMGDRKGWILWKRISHYIALIAVFGVLVFAGMEEYGRKGSLVHILSINRIFEFTLMPLIGYIVLRLVLTYILIVGSFAAVIFFTASLLNALG